MSDSEWLTFSQLAQRFEITPECARQRAIRGNLKRSINNDGQVIVMLPEDFIVRSKKKNKTPNVSTETTAPKQSQTFSNKEKDLERIISVLEAHIGTLEKELSFARQLLFEERRNALQSLEIIKDLTAQLANMRSAPVVQTRQTETMDQIIMRMKMKAAAKIVAA